MVFKRDLHTTLNAPLDVSNRLASGKWQSELASIVKNILTEVRQASRPDVVHEIEQALDGGSSSAEDLEVVLEKAVDLRDELVKGGNGVVAERVAELELKLS